MTDNQKRILEMLAEKKITVDEAEKLLTLIVSRESTGDRLHDTVADRKQPPKYLRVVVQPGSEGGSGHHAERVNIRVPMNLIRAGMKLTSLIPAHAADTVNEAMKEKGVDFDLRNLKMEDITSRCIHVSDINTDKFSFIEVTAIPDEMGHLVLCPNNTKCEEHKDYSGDKIKITTVKRV